MTRESIEHACDVVMMLACILVTARYIYVVESKHPIFWTIFVVVASLSSLYRLAF